MRVQSPPSFPPGLVEILSKSHAAGVLDADAAAAVSMAETPNLFLGPRVTPSFEERRAVVAAIVEANYGAGPWPPLIEGIIDGIAETARGFGETLELTWEIFSSEEKRQELLDLGNQLLEMGQELLSLSPEERMEVLKDAGETLLEAVFGSYEEFMENPSYFVGKLIGETMVGGVLGKVTKMVKGLKAVREVIERFKLRKKDRGPEAPKAETEAPKAETEGPKAETEGPKAETEGPPPKRSADSADRKDRRPEETRDRPDKSRKRDRPEGDGGPEGPGRPRTRPEGERGPSSRDGRDAPEVKDKDRDRPLGPADPAPKIRNPEPRPPTLRGDPGESWSSAGDHTISTSRNVRTETHPNSGKPVRTHETRVYRHRAKIDLNGNGPDPTDAWVVVEFEIDIDWKDINQGGFREAKLDALSQRRMQAQKDAVQSRKAELLDEIDRNGFNLPDVSRWRTLQLAHRGNPTLAVDTPQGTRVYLELKSNGELERFEGPSPQKQLGPVSAADATDGYGKNAELNAYRAARKKHFAQQGRISSNPRTKSNGAKAANTEAGEIWSGQGLDFHTNLPERVRNILRGLDDPQTSTEIIELLRARIDNYPYHTRKRYRAEKQLEAFQSFEALKAKYGNFEINFTRRGVPDFKRFVPTWAPKIQVAPSSPTKTPARLRAEAAAATDPSEAFKLRQQAARQQRRGELEAAVARNAPADEVKRLKASLRGIDAREAQRQFKEFSGLDWSKGTIREQFDAADAPTQAKIEAFMAKGKLDWDTQLSQEFRLHHGVNPGDVQIVPADLHDFIKHIGGSAYW